MESVALPRLEKQNPGGAYQDHHATGTDQSHDGPKKAWMGGPFDNVELHSNLSLR